MLSEIGVNFGSYFQNEIYRKQCANLYLLELTIKMKCIHHRLSLFLLQIHNFRYFLNVFFHSLHR